MLNQANDPGGALPTRPRLLETVIEPLKSHLVRVKVVHEADLLAGYGEVEMPDAFARKFLRGP